MSQAQNRKTASDIQPITTKGAVNYELHTINYESIWKT